jgi:acetyl esterase/lipase
VGDEVADAKDAMRWVRGHARDLGVDPKRIAAFGGSSGGHLAISAAVFDEKDKAGVSSRPDLLVLFYPCLDLTSEFEQGSAKAIGKHGKDLSPLYHIRAGLPATYLFEGTKDPLFPENRQFCDQTQALGNVCKWAQYEGAPHGFFSAQMKPPSPYFETAQKAMDDALAAEGYLPRS